MPPPRRNRHTGLTAASGTTFEGGPFLVGTFDLGVRRFLVVQGITGVVRSADGAGAVYPSENFELIGAADTIGIGWNGTRFHRTTKRISSNGVFVARKIYQLSTLKSGRTIDIAYTWYDSDAGGTGTHETTASQKVTLTQGARTWLRITTPPPADSGGADDPDSARLYVGPQNGTLRRQAAHFVGVSPPLEGINPTVGDPVPASNTFPAGTPAVQKATVGGYEVDGRSDGSVGEGSFRTSVWTDLAYSERGKSATQTLDTATYTTVTTPADSVDTPTAGITYNAGVYTVTQAGLYLINTHIVFTSNATGRRLVRLWLNAENYETVEVPLVSGQATQSRPSWALKLAPGDVFEVQAYQNSGGNLTLTATTRVTVAQLTRSA